MALFLGVVAGCSRPQPPAVIDPDLVAASVQPDPESLACAACHPAIFDQWAGSQHANANRLVSDALDRAAFDPPTRVAHGSFVTTMKRSGRDAFDFLTVHSNGAPETFRAEAVIGITPLRQYLVTYPGGRLQTMDMSYDPRSNEWFNAFGDEDRQPHEWGHWRGRSMNWNSQCAFCHMTGYEKRYDLATDAYNSTWKAMGISCTQCHRLKEEVPGVRFRVSEKTNECPMVASNDPDTLPSDTRHPAPDTVVMDNCASCHARREELFGSFKPGDAFHDHFRLTLPDSPGVFHADGQVLQEDFEYASFMMSRMGHKGVTCLDCHDPHSSKLKAPVENNALCMQCHTPPGLNGAVPIDPVAHMFHKPGTPGGRCVDCHMPENVYMVRDPRRDHGFTSPDPQLTIEHGIPNACNRCHQNQTVAWAAEWTERWYGERMNRRARERARAVARYHEGDPTVASNLLHLAQTEEIDAWRAALVGMLGSWPDDPAIQSYLRTALVDPHPLVRSAAVRGSADSPESMLTDTSALVRIDATLSRWSRNPNRPPADRREVIAYIRNMSDQPAGAMRQSQVAMLENRPDDAEAWMQKAIAWDPLSALPRYELGRFQVIRGHLSPGISNLHAAAVMESGNAEFSHALALAIAEAGDAAAALSWLKETVRRDPSFGRAWYNLGLAQAGAGDLSEALKDLHRAESLLAGSGDPAFAAATLHLRMNRADLAAAAVERALAAQPDHREARRLQRQLVRP